MSVDTNHLNKVLADFCGKRVMALSNGWVLYPPDAVCNWNPCEDHNQMAEVKAKLREKGYGYITIYSQYESSYQAAVENDKGKSFTVECKESELLALALAVEKMKEGER